MKKFIQKALACMMALAVVLTVSALPLQTANAATTGVKIYFQNNQGWDKVNAYIWQGSGPVSGTSAWPGAVMTKVSGTDNWYELTYTGASKFNVIFNNGAATPKQTANHTPADLATDKDAYWFTPSNESASSNAYGASVSQSPSARRRPPGSRLRQAARPPRRAAFPPQRPRLPAQRTAAPRPATPAAQPQSQSQELPHSAA